VTDEETKLQLAALEDEKRNYEHSLAVARDAKDKDGIATFEGNLKEVDKALAALKPKPKAAKKAKKK